MRAKAEYRERTIRIRCNSCREWVEEKDAAFVNIEENMMGEDVLTFICPLCGKMVKSRRYG